MKHWRDILISPDVTILKAIEMIDAGRLQIVLVVDESEKLVGTVTDGDIRRAILKGVSLQKPVSEIMYRDPTVAVIHESRDSVMSKMKTKQLSQLPLIDDEGRVVGIDVLSDLLNVRERDNVVLLMAGGLGSRLGDLTKDCPKPLLCVGNKPVLETILSNCIEYGFTRFYIAINYKAEMVKAHFGDGSRWGVDIQYIEENKRLGTAGALALLPELPTSPVLVMNGDVLTKVNFDQLFDFHEQHDALATMCVREYDLQVPYGVVKTDTHKLVAIEEKPVHRFFVNAGIYILNPCCIDLVPKAEFFDMPTLFENLLSDRADIAVFPIREYWLDIGRVNDYQQANDEYVTIFT